MDARLRWLLLGLEVRAERIAARGLRCKIRKVDLHTEEAIRAAAARAVERSALRARALLWGCQS